MVVRVARDPSLRRLGVAFAGFSLAEHATWLAMLVYAFQRGGVHEASGVAVIQLLPAMLLAPFAAYAGDRFEPRHALAAGYGAQAVAMAVTASAMAAGSPVAAYAGGALTAMSVTFTRPVMGSLLPNVTHAPSDLIAANLVLGFVEQLGRFMGPVLAGLAMAIASPTTVYASSAVIVAVSTALVAGLGHGERHGERHSETAGIGAGGIGRIAARDVVSEVFAGFRSLARYPRVRVLVALMTVGALAAGIADVVMVLFADVRLQGGGGSVGLLGAAVGVGAIIGSLAGAGLLGGSAAPRYLASSAALLGLSLSGLAVAHRLAPAMVLFLLLGAGEALLHLTSAIAIQRHAPLNVLARIFGVIEGLQMAALAVGSLLVSTLHARMSLGWTLLSLSSLVLVLLAVGLVRLRRTGGDAPPLDTAVIDLLLSDPLMASLPAPSIERLARSVERVRVPTGAHVVSEGEIGDRYFLVISGVARVTIEGRHVRDLHAGGSFGEIALLRDIPRTATVTAAASGDVELLAVPRGPFLEAISGHPRSLGAATVVVDRFLDT